MKFLILLLLIPLLLSNYSFADLDSVEYSAREQGNSKISPILLKWKASDNPEEFAKSNGLLYTDGMIQVYIHLTSEEFLSQISSEIKVVASDQKIAVAYVTPQQLQTFESLDFVEKVSLPDLARTPPIPQIVIPKNHQEEETSDFTLMIIIIILIVIFAFIAIILQRKKTKSARQ